MTTEHRVEAIDNAEVDRYRRGTYLLTTIIPLVNGPKRNIYRLDQSGLDDFLEHYCDYAEFIVELAKVSDPTEATVDDAEFRRLLRQALLLPDDASDYAILAEVETAYHFYVLNRPAPGGDPQ